MDRSKVVSKGVPGNCGNAIGTSGQCETRSVSTNSGDNGGCGAGSSEELENNFFNSFQDGGSNSSRVERVEGTEGVCDSESRRDGITESDTAENGGEGDSISYPGIYRSETVSFSIEHGEG